MRACLRLTMSSTRTMSRSLERPTTICFSGTIGNSPPWYLPLMKRSTYERAPAGGRAVGTLGLGDGSCITREAHTHASVLVLGCAPDGKEARCKLPEKSSKRVTSAPKLGQVGVEKEPVMPRQTHGPLALPRPVVPGGDPFGTHRALVPPGALPQPAQRVDNDFSRLFAGELLLAVETLNVDAASFRQMEEVTTSEEALGKKILETVLARGKQHNPVTGSGGMLLGRVLQVTEGHPEAATLEPGARVATLVSLSLTPLRIDRIKEMRRASAQVDVEGEALLFASGAFARMPSDMSERLALAVLDVAGAAPQVARLVKPGASVLVLGAGGKSGILCVAEARRAGGKSA